MSQTKKNKKQGTPLAPDFVPGDYDVVCAKGKAVQNHVGNRRFRVICRMHLERYNAATSKQEKSRIVSDIVDTIRQASPDGGFVKLDPLTGSWREVGDHLAREKVGQTLRDSLHTKYSSSTKAKKERRQAEKVRARAMSESHQTEVLPMPSTLSAFTTFQEQEAMPAPVLSAAPLVISSAPSVTTTSIRSETLDQLRAQLQGQQDFRPPSQPQDQESLQKTHSSCLLDIFFDEKHYQALKDLNDDELNPNLMTRLSNPSPNIVRGKAA
eukprot:CAMPEP_0202497352 /NCGR_PEP_ID=MMETSP1361-20130828/22595_1 /ASSEMBLY_ACC=CAM_ASM_000849 /TAXON_ID=210615 /ORGANISM="Staurosira complex sp., Strain CCMP2646" /LENGTH=267 /DNA_ID=CAMNT_0049128931 /DNA_START=95 /DNA_END=898 /DNA_ORIENTATION=+